MCLSILKSKRIVQRKADKDYYVYKVMSTYSGTKNLYSRFFGMDYTIGCSYEAEIGVSSFKSHKEYTTGLHYYMTLEAASFNALPWHKIVECILPKGSLYIEDPEQKLGICNKLTINKII